MATPESGHLERNASVTDVSRKYCTYPPKVATKPIVLAATYTLPCCRMSLMKLVTAAQPSVTRKPNRTIRNKADHTSMPAAANMITIVEYA